MKYTALFEILFRTHMNDLILGFLGMGASGLTLMSDYQKEQEKWNEIMDLREEREVYKQGKNKGFRRLGSMAELP